MDFKETTNTVQMMPQTDPAIVAAAETAKAQIQAAYLMALHHPRSMEQARLRLLQHCKRPEFAARAEYAKPVGKKKDDTGRWVQNYIVGASVRLVESALREFGNVRTEIQVLYDDDYVRRLLVSVIDLESNTCFSKQVQIRKTIERKSNDGKEVIGQRLNSYGETVFIVKATDDELQIKENALISKIIRNEGLRILPSDIMDEAIATARKTLATQDAKDPKAAEKALLDAFFNLGVEPKDIEEYLGHTTRTLNPAEIKELRAIYAAIRDGEARWADFLNKTEEDEDGMVTAKTSQATKDLRDRLKKQANGTQTAAPEAESTVKTAPATEDDNQPL